MYPTGQAENNYVAIRGSNTAFGGGNRADSQAGGPAAQPQSKLEVCIGSLHNALDGLDHAVGLIQTRLQSVSQPMPEMGKQCSNPNAPSAVCSQALASIERATARVLEASRRLNDMRGLLET